ncbi:hypothetical protein LTR08_000883 [Meristemomyces frigidus]|nr:hypothetical protein LTR08_000883 [Meristemomyces frigidus]
MQTTSAACGALSLATPIGFQSGDCGYCKAEDSSASYYARSKSLCPKHYQILMDRGWRRSGSLIYLPDASRSCCPHYTIRLPASELKPSRDQRQTLNRWNRYVLGEAYSREVSAKYPKTKAAKKRENNTFDLLSTVHESETPALKPDIAPEHRFEVTLEPDTYTAEKFALFADYQRHVHHENAADISEAGFTRFLCDSPLHRHTEPGGKKLGSFHQCYRLNGRLVAMSVLDLLPHGVSGVYFLYHHDFEKWSFGKLSALREAALALEGGYGFYYMGYYIQGCGKMAYKGEFRPQYVLDLWSGEWGVLDEGMRGLMDRKGYASLSRERARRGRVGGGSGGTGAGLEGKTEEIAGETGASANSIAGTTALSAPPPTAQQEEEEDLASAAESPIMHPTPFLATHSGLSLLALGMPGVLTLAQLRAAVDLDAMKISLGRGGGDVHEMREIGGWGEGSETEVRSVKGVVAEFAAAVGGEVAGGVVLDFGR